MKTKLVSGLLAAIFLVCLSGCGQSARTPKIGVSLGVGEAARWVSEQQFMEDRAKELGAEIEVRLNKTDVPTQEEDCRQLIDSGIDVLILTPRNANNVDAILDYAAEKKVKVINYARVVLGRPVDLFVGYDSNRMGQSMGQFISELVYQGDYILLSGDDGDNNAKLLNDGAMRYIDPIRGSIHILVEAPVPGWSTEEAAKLVRQAVSENGNQVDAIMAPNDKIAGACADVLAELGVTDPVVITGTDAEPDALRRIVAGTQSMTIYMDLKELAYTAVDQACNMAQGKPVDVNAEFDNQSDAPVPSHLITGQVVTRENLDKLLIEPGHFTHQEVYGS